VRRLRWFSKGDWRHRPPPYPSPPRPPPLPSPLVPLSLPSPRPLVGARERGFVGRFPRHFRVPALRRVRGEGPCCGASTPEKNEAPRGPKPRSATFRGGRAWALTWAIVLMLDIRIVILHLLARSWTRSKGAAGANIYTYPRRRAVADDESPRTGRDSSAWNTHMPGARSRAASATFPSTRRRHVTGRSLWVVRARTAPGGRAARRRKSRGRCARGRSRR